MMQGAKRFLTAVALLAVASGAPADSLGDALGNSSQGVTSAALDALLGTTQGYLATRNSTSWTGLGGTGLLHGAGAANLSFSAVAPVDTTSNQGNGVKFQLSTGSTTTNDCVKFDANGNTVDAGAGCGSGSGGGGTFNYSDNGVTVTANTYYTPIGGGGVPTTTEANVDVAAPAAATVSNLQVSVSVAPGAGNSYTITLRDAGSDTALTCAISGASATSCSDLTHSVNISAGNLVAWKFVSAGTIVTTPTVNITAANGTSGVGITSIATTSPITGGTITTTGTIACATCTTNASALTANQLVIGGGSQASAVLGSLGSTTTLLHGNAGGAPSFGAVSLTADVTGVLPAGNAPQSTSGALGYSQCDGTTITCSSGIHSAATGLNSATVALSSADLLAIKTTPKTIVAAPGSGKAIVPYLVFATLDYNTTTYAVCTTAQFFWGGSTNSAISLLGFLTGTASQFIWGTYSIGSGAKVSANANNQALTFSANADCTTGNSTGSVTVLYAVVTL